MSNELVSLNISEDMIQGIVSKQIQQAIVRELGNTDQYVEALVASALHQKVSSSGDVSRYSGDNRYDFLDILLKKKCRRQLTKR